MTRGQRYGAAFFCRLGCRYYIAHRGMDIGIDYICPRVWRAEVRRDEYVFAPTLRELERKMESIKP